jgi:hypothetical protein
VSDFFGAGNFISAGNLMHYCKAKVVAGIVLSLRYAHILGLLQGHVAASKIRFDSDDYMEIVDFQPILLKAGENESEEGTQLGGISREGWTTKNDVHAFASILFEIVVGEPARDSGSHPNENRHSKIFSRFRRQTTFGLTIMLTQQKFLVHHGGP